MKKNALLKQAKQFAIDAHNSIGHRRKYTDEPYHVHLERVANLVATVTTNAEIIVAAWLHDVIEDVAPKNNDFNENAIRQLFGDHVLKLVLEVSDVSKLEDGNRSKRKAIDREHLAKASNEGKLIKLADLIDNVVDISKHDPHFARVIRKEAALLLPSLQSGNKVLYEALKKLLKIK